MEEKFRHNCKNCIYLGSRDMNPYPHAQEYKEYWVEGIL